MSIDRITENIAKYMSDFDKGLIERALELAAQAHKDQLRESGQPFIIHPLAVAEILTEMEQDLETIAASLLHDVVEDTSVTMEQIEKEFGQDVAQLVDGVTKLKRLRFHTKADHQAENLRKMFMAMAKDFRVIIIKFADRLHNMRTLEYLPAAKQKELARETMEIYAPLAHRLGIFRFKWELEDLAFRYLQPKNYYNLVSDLRQRREEREQLISTLISQLHKTLEEAGIKVELTGRPKHLYSIWRKMEDQQKTVNEIFDLTAVRMVVDSVRDCYSVLGHVHNIYKPIPGRFKDYIAMPKGNGYQSLHTTVIVPKGRPVEIQIRTRQMHRQAEYGLAAHWRYKEGRKADLAFEEKLSWFRQFMEWQSDLRDTNEYIETVKIDLFDDEVLVFTPKGDVIDLPIGAVPLDFAYRIHTDIGNATVGAKVNGRLVPLDHKLATGDIVEITTQKGATPSRDWLNIVKSSQARTKIRQWFKKVGREQNIEKGKELLAKELKRFNLALSQVEQPLWQQLLQRFNYSEQQQQDFYAALGYGGLSAVSAARTLYEMVNRQREQEKTLADVDQTGSAATRPASTQGVRVKGVDNLLVRFSRCCKPLPGDGIVGYVTRGRGVSIHRNDCPNVRGAEDERLLPVQWEDIEGQAYPVELVIKAWDRKGLLQEVMTVLGETKSNILAIKGSGVGDGSAQVSLTVEVQGVEHLALITDRLRRVSSILEVKRRSTGGGDKNAGSGAKGQQGRSKG